MKEIDTKPIERSVERLVEGSEGYQRTGDPVWILFLKRESFILLKRVIKFCKSLNSGSD